jgi:hypothetical protein
LGIAGVAAVMCCTLPTAAQTARRRIGNVLLALWATVIVALL